MGVYSITNFPVVNIDHSNVVALDDYDEDDDGVGPGSIKPPPKKPRQKGPLDKFYVNKPEDKLKGRKMWKTANN